MSQQEEWVYAQRATAQLLQEKIDTIQKEIDVKESWITEKHWEIWLRKSISFYIAKTLWRKEFKPPKDKLMELYEEKEKLEEKQRRQQWYLSTTNQEIINTVWNLDTYNDPVTRDIDTILQRINNLHDSWLTYNTLIQNSQGIVLSAQKNEILDMAVSNTGFLWFGIVQLSSRKNSAVAETVQQISRERNIIVQNFERIAQQWEQFADRDYGKFWWLVNALEIWSDITTFLKGKSSTFNGIMWILSVRQNWKAWNIINTYTNEAPKIEAEIKNLYGMVKRKKDRYVLNVLSKKASDSWSKK